MIIISKNESVNLQVQISNAYILEEELESLIESIQKAAWESTPTQQGSYGPRQWKVAEIIMIPKPNKPLNDKTSYRPISLLTITSKIFEKLFLKRLKTIIEHRKLIPTHQFGFRERHSTIEEVHRTTDTIEEVLEQKKVCSAVFLDVAQAFDKVWHRGLEFKLQRDLPKQYFEVLKSYINDRYFRVRQEGEYSKLKKILAGVPQGSVLGPNIRS